MKPETFKQISELNGVECAEECEKIQIALNQAVFHNSNVKLTDDDLIDLVKTISSLKDNELSNWENILKAINVTWKSRFPENQYKEILILIERHYGP